MSLIAEIIIAGLLVVGGIFGVVGSWGLVRLPDPMTRLHAPTKAATLGVGAVLIASMAAMWFRFGIVSWHEFLIALFLFLTAPITGLFIAKAHMHLSWGRDELPPPPDSQPTPADPSGIEWATYGDSAAESLMVGALDEPRRKE